MDTQAFLIRALAPFSLATPEQLARLDNPTPSNVVELATWRATRTISEK